MKFDWNDLAMAGLGAIFVVFGVNLLSEGIYETEVPETAGYEIEGAVQEVAAAAEEETVIADAGTIMASADAAAGENVAKKCVACHNFNDGGANKVGPGLYNIVGRAIAGVDGFGYSGALKEYGEGKVWDFAELNGFLYKPKEYVKGTSMGFAGLKKDDERGAMLMYLRSLAASPAEIPAPTPAATEGDAAVDPAKTNEPGDEAQPENPAAEAAGEVAPDPVTEEVETPTQPEAGTAEPVDPAVLNPVDNPTTGDAAPAADPGVSPPGTGDATGYGASEPKDGPLQPEDPADASTGKAEEADPAETETETETEAETENN